jgi:hypothetical protein
MDNIRCVQPCLGASWASSVSAGPGLVLGPHNPEVTGSNPVPATSPTSANDKGRVFRPFRIPPEFPQELPEPLQVAATGWGAGELNDR